MAIAASELDFQLLINTHLKPTFRKDNEWAVFYADAFDDVYDTHEYISKVREDQSGISAFERAQVLFYINKIEPKLKKLMGLMHKSAYKSQYYNRLWSELTGIRNDIPVIREQLYM